RSAAARRTRGFICLMVRSKRSADSSVCSMIGMTFDLRRFSINTATLGYQAPLSDTIEAVARAGFGGISPWRREVENENVRALASQIRAAGLQVSGYCRSTYFPGSPKRERLANVHDNRTAL